MIKLKAQFLIFLLVIILQGCAPPGVNRMEATLAASTPGEIPTWTPRPGEASAFPTATRPFDQTQDGPAPTMEAQTAAQSVTNPPPPSPTLMVVTISVKGGNLNVRRGPSTDYNPLYVLRDGETATVIGRDRISRWVLIEVPSVPGARGWVTTETEYSTVTGDAPSLPFLTEEPASPSFIRNCTKHELWVMPAQVKLLSKFDKPDNEERFGPGVYQVYDLDGPQDYFETVSLLEGKTVEIRVDWNGEKSKCE